MFGEFFGRWVRMVGMPLVVGGWDARMTLGVGGKWVGEAVRRWFAGAVGS